MHRMILTQVSSIPPSEPVSRNAYAYDLLRGLINV